MSGKIVAGGFFVFLFIFAASLYYMQNYAYYQKVEGLTSITVEGREITVSGYVGLDADSSSLKLRGCFTVDPADFDGVTRHENPVPLGTPKWFECYQAAAIGADLQSGAAVAYLVAKEEFDGIDRVVAVYSDGRAYQWRQLNNKYQE